MISSPAGRLVHASINGITSSYVYRADGLRASKSVNGQSTRFHYDFANRLIAESDASGAIREYLWDDDAPVAVIQSGVITYLHADALGTPRLGTNAAKQTVWAWNSDAFGSVPPTGTVAHSLRFPGQVADPDSGLVFNGWRTYFPSAGRYLESDPIGLNGGLNSYLYAKANPLSFIDSDGRNPVLALLGAGLIANEIATSDVPLIGGGIASRAEKVGACGGIVPKIGSSGGNGAGKGFSNKIKAQARSESNGVCVFCGVKTNQVAGPTRSEIDHAIPKSRNGNNGIDNAQNTCRTCNRQKGPKTTEEFLR